MNSGIFEGGFRRLPEQNLAGASKHCEKSDFLHRIHLERSNRVCRAERERCAVFIQAVIRGFLVRRRHRLTCERTVLQAFSSKPSPPTTRLSLEHIGSALVSYYSLKSWNHPHILEWITECLYEECSDVVLKLSEGDSNSSWVWLWRLRWLMKMHVSNIRHAVHIRHRRNNSTPCSTGTVTDAGTEGDESVSTLSHRLSASVHAIEYFTNPHLYEARAGEREASLIVNKLLMYSVENGLLTALDESIHTEDWRVTDSSANRDIILTLLWRPLKYTFSQRDKYMVMKELGSVMLTDCTSALVYYKVLPTIISVDHQMATCLIDAVIDSAVPFTSSTLHVLLKLLERGGSTWRIFLALAKVLQVDWGRWEEDSEESDADTCCESEDEEKPSQAEGGRHASLPARYLESLPSYNCRMLETSFKYMSSFDFSMAVIRQLEGNYNQDNILHFTKLLYALTRKDEWIEHKVLWHGAIHPSLYVDLWKLVSSLSRQSADTEKIPLINILAKGSLPTPAEGEMFYPLLISFCLIFKCSMSMLTDSDMDQIHSALMKLSLQQIDDMCIKLRDIALFLMDLGLPDTPRKAYLKNVSDQTILMLKDTYKAVIYLLRTLYWREVGPDKSKWISNKVCISSHMDLTSWRLILSRHKLFHPMTMNDRYLIVTNNLAKPYVILRDLPFSFSIKDRINVLHSMFSMVKIQLQNTNEFATDDTFIKIRRNYIYEDAFSKLSQTELPEIKSTVRIRLTNAVGLEEAGVDGGGIFKEFISEFLKEAFNPNRGFFIINKQRQLLPNPNVAVLYPDYKRHYHFIGRLLAKALFENVVVEIPFAEFFLSRLINVEKDVNLYDLYSLDPELFKHLVSLRAYEEELSNLALNYTVVTDVYGQTKVSELIAGGEKVPVSKSNKIDYIQKVAEYKLNTQFHFQCYYFRKGFSDVFDTFWLVMFSPKELQNFIFCSDTPVDVEDLKSNCCYTGGYSSSHPNIIRFWNVVENLKDSDRKLLLKFVTCCSRQPLLGFKDLEPPFTIQLVDTINRLPSASTCMNLLKLPIFTNEEIMKSKILYSIQSQSGFELC